MSRWLHVVVVLAPLLVSVFESSWVTRAAAQPSGVLVVATHEGSPPVPRALLTEIAGLRLDGAPLLLGGEAVASYRDTVSREPSRLGADAFDELSQSTRRAIRHVALRQTEEARTLIANLLTSAERALDALNREEQGARAVLDACLSLARSYLENGSPEQAEEHALACRRLVPDLAPTQTHPPEIHELVRQVDARLSRMRASIRVESEPSGCAVFVNGRELGISPFEIRAPQGSYRLQVRCGDEESRVHSLLLGSEPAVVRIDVALDRVLRTDQQLALVYPDAPALERQGHEHARAIARSLQVPSVLTIVRVPEGWRVDRVAVTGQVEVSTWVAVSPTVQSATLAIAALRERRSLDVSGSEPRERAPYRGAVDESAPTVEVTPPAEMPAEPERARRTTPTRIALGITSTAIGFGALAAGIAFHVRTDDATDALDAASRLTPGFVGLVDDFDQARRRSLVFTSVSGVALTLGLSWLALDREKTPWWSWVLGAAGLGSTVVGVISVLGDRACLDQDCSRREAPETAGVAWIAGGLPLLALPFVQLVRGSRSPSSRQPETTLSWLIQHDRITLVGNF